MAEIISLGAIPDVEETHSLLLDLRRRLDAGEDLGSRVVHIREAAAAMRASAGGLRRMLEAPDERLSANPGLLALARKVLALAERNIAAAEEMLCLLANRAT
ncbi:HPt domain-containing protein [Methylorubrum thiocyanatum]